MKKQSEVSKTGFTLIELLIVVAIIAILAAIAVPNFLEAQVRAKVSRVKSDFRTLATAIESYTVDYNRPPLGFQECDPAQTSVMGTPTPPRRPWVWMHFTTPAAYITSVPLDPFNLSGTGRINAQGKLDTQAFFEYEAINATYPRTGASRGGVWPSLTAKGFAWYLYGIGPSRRWTAMPGNITIWIPGALDRQPDSSSSIAYPSSYYDPSNGTMSTGRIVRTNHGMEPAG